MLQALIRFSKLSSFVLGSTSLAGVLIISAVGSRAMAFDIFPEFHSVNEFEGERLDETTRIDSEYQSDYITYLMPMAWNAEFHQSPAAFDFTVGSLSNKFFMQHTRMKISKELLPDLTFRFTYFQQRDHDIKQSRGILELVKKINPFFSISAYGEPSFFKRENDLGLAALFRPSPMHEVRVFHTWVDITRQDHNDRPDHFATGLEPRSLGFVGRCSGCLGLSRETGTTEFSESGVGTSSAISLDWIEYFLRWETPTRWRFPMEEYDYDYENYAAGLSFRVAPPKWDGLFANLRLQASRKIEGFTATSPGSPIAGQATEGFLDRRLIQALGSVEFTHLSVFGRKATFEPGLGWFHRFWRGDDDQSLDHRNLIPHAWLKIEGPARGAGRRDTIEFGLETTFFTSSGGAPLAAPELKSFAAEHRGNIRYVIPFDDRAQFTLALTVDIDAMITGQGGAFEGGNGQFRAFF